jgi:hypothetical protein
MSGTHHFVRKYTTTTIDKCQSLFGCHVAVGDVAPKFCVREISSGGGAHLGPFVVAGSRSLAVVDSGGGVAHLMAILPPPSLPAIVVRHRGCCRCGVVGVRHYR